MEVFESAEPSSVAKESSVQSLLLPQQDNKGSAFASLSAQSLLIPRRVRRDASRPFARPHDVYISRRHPLIVYYKRVQHLFSTPSVSFVCIHGLGACIKGAIWLSQDILQSYEHFVSVEVSTSTTVCIDDYPEIDEHSFLLASSKERNVSGINIKFNKLRPII
ncbi:hypothetical protein IE077_003303 [Cardiosporidium cionae]|uniref:Uncharacterized protein n=1 Tax=Cardiosporidium cionae TaxID=476202 RepID=A0ABQ7J8L2_9APIC|nr:hypothetical protein IE077_003303 [Cardiosporidium cionae]|eukprot:KAF8820309.1 hypothetical protein IE077_003303 [Cardiosporidium cionae]